jgi:hypothetical protein
LLPVLHPGLKLAYFRQQNWPLEWIENAKRITRTEFNGYMALHAAQTIDEVEVVVREHSILLAAHS